MAAGPAAQLGEDISQAGSGDGMKRAVVSHMLEKEREKKSSEFPNTSNASLSLQILVTTSTPY